MNRIILCNCDIEAESNFLLKLLAACENSGTKIDLEMYFTVNLAFVNYFDKAIEELGIPVLRNWTTQEQVLPFSVEIFEISPHLLNPPKTLKDLVNQYKNKEKILELQGQKERNNKIWFFPQKFSGRCTSFLSCIGNNDYNISSNLHGMWTIKIESISSKYSLTTFQRNRSSRYDRHILYVLNKLVYCRYVTNNNDRHILSCY